VAGSGPAWRRAADAGAIVACALALWWAFIVGESVPLLRYVDLGFHELGHLVLAWAPGLAGPLAGSIAQIAVPLGLACYFGFGRRESYAAALLLAWTGTSAANVAVYVVDAPLQSLPLLGNGQHDWAFIFNSLGHLEWAAPAAEAVRLFGLAAVLLGILVASIALVRSYTEPRATVRRRMTEADGLAALPRHEPRNGSLGRNAPGARPGPVGAGLSGPGAGPAPWRAPQP
jgi:hypothetical protein